ncbi:IS66 family transposase [Acutalibacter muris]
MPKSAYGAALTYAVKQKDWLMHVFLDGRLELSNNRAERGVRP